MKKDELTMSVSPICFKNGKKYAFVRFTDNKKYCEWMIPDAKLKVNHGFTDEEIAGLKFYVKNNMTEIKRMAAQINLLKVF